MADPHPPSDLAPSDLTPSDLAASDPEDAPFLARQGYVQRRLGDAARLLPLLGVMLFLLPLLWLMDGDAPRTAHGVIYVFAIWSALIIAAAILAPRLMTRRLMNPRQMTRSPDRDAPDPSAPEPPEGTR